MRNQVRGALRGALAVVFVVVAATACGDNGDAPSEPDAGMPDSGGPDAGLPDAMPPDGPLPPDPGPFPLNPRAGQYEWAVIIPGLGDQVVMAVGEDGSIFIAGTHRAAVDFQGIRLAAPVGAAVAVLKLDARAKPIWGRSFGGGAEPSWRTNVRSIAVTASGDVVVGGAFLGSGFDVGTGALPAEGNTEGFVARLDGNTGSTEWARSFTGHNDDNVSTVAAEASSDDIYVHGQIEGQAVGGVWQPSYTFLERYDESGQRVWRRQLPTRVFWQHQMAVDRLRGPVVTGRYHGSLEVDGLRLQVEPGDEKGNLAVIGFTPDGHARFARQIFDENRGYYQRLLAAPNQRLYVSTTTEGKEIVLDDGRSLKGPDYSSDAALVRLTPEGEHDWSTVIDTQLAAYPNALAADADGAVYLAAYCDQRISLSPPISCSNGGGFLVSYGPDGGYRWSTYLYGSPAWMQALAAVPGRNRLLVAGETGPRSEEGADFGGVRVPGGRGLFVASVVTGPTYADPALPTPVVSSVVLEGIADGHIRQGGSGTVVVSGEHLEQIKSVRVGSRDVFVAAEDATPGTVRIPYVVPHGEAIGPLSLVLTLPRGRLNVPTSLEVSPIVVSPSGSDTGRGTVSSPMRLCRESWWDIAERGDTIRLLAGVHQCERAIYLSRGVSVEGAGTTQTKVGIAGRRFGPFSLSEGPHGQTRISQLTFQSGDYGAISNFDGVTDLAVRDVDFVGLSTAGLVTSSSTGRVALERVRYIGGRGAAIYADGDIHIEGRQVTVQTEWEGIMMLNGQLTLRDSVVKSARTAILLGDFNDPRALPRQLVLERSSLSSHRGVLSYGADLFMTDSELSLVGDPDSSKGISFIGGTLTAIRTRVHGFLIGISPTLGPVGDPTFALPGEFEHVANMDLDDVDVTAASVGVECEIFSEPSWLRMRRSRISGEESAFLIWDQFTSIDLGTAGAPGANTLTSSPSGHAFNDTRAAPGPAVDAVGTTLNGNAYSGEQLGPRSDADLAQRAANVVRF